MKNIYVIQGGKQSGPYSPIQIIEKVMRGELTGNDYGWCGDPSRIVPLSEIIAKAKLGGSETPKKECSVVDLVQLAGCYRTLTGILLFSIPVAFLVVSDGDDLFFSGVTVTLSVLCVINCIWIARITGKNVWLWLLLLLVPCVSLGACIQLIRGARKVLMAHGLRSRWLTGVPQADLTRLVADWPQAPIEQEPLSFVQS